MKNELFRKVKMVELTCGKQNFQITLKQYKNAKKIILKK